MKKIFLYCLFFMCVCGHNHSLIAQTWNPNQFHNWNSDSIDSMFNQNNSLEDYNSSYWDKMGETSTDDFYIDQKGRGFYSGSSYENKNRSYAGDGASTGQDNCLGMWITRNDGSGYCCGDCK